MRFFVLCLLSLPAGLTAEPVPAYRPGPRPDRIILTWHGDPSTSMSVSWRTDTSVGEARAEIAVAGDGPGFVKEARQVKATTAKLVTAAGEAHVHTARFTQLAPNTVYAYRVGGDKHWSSWNQFQTASDRPAPLTLLYSADAQNDILSHWSRVIRTGFREAPKAEVIVHAGDLVNRGDDDQQWGEWFEAAGWIHTAVPCFPTPGNHEYSSIAGRRSLTAHWRGQFDLPENGVAGLEESNYYVDLQGVRMISLNSNEKLEEQAAWLDQLLQQNPNRWTIAAFHHPVFSSARGRDNKKLRELWQPLFEKHAVDLVLTGHDHTYARGNLPSGVKALPQRGGTIYVVSVAGPKMYNLQREPWVRRAAEDTQLVQVIRVSGDRLSFQAFTAAGRLYDAFELRKRPGRRPAELIERVPRDPERLRAPAAVPTGQ